MENEVLAGLIGHIDRDLDGLAGNEVVARHFQPHLDLGAGGRQAQAEEDEGEKEADSGHGLEGLAQAPRRVNPTGRQVV